MAESGEIQPPTSALDEHLDAHGCGTGDHNDPRYVGGFVNCPEAWALWEAIPIEVRPVPQAAHPGRNIHDKEEDISGASVQT